MALIPAPADFTDFDFNSLRARLVRLVASALPDLDLDSQAELTAAILESEAHVGDILGFYARKIARESRFATATQRRSMLGLIKLIGYQARGATAARVVETFTLAAAMAGTFELKAGTFVSTREVTTPIRYQLLEALVFAPGTTTLTATVENSKNATATFTSSGLANQRYLLTESPYLDGSAIPIAANGTYTEVRNFLRSTSSDLHFVVVVDQNDRATLVFGNGINGAIPVGDISVSYKTGGGAAGSVASGALSVIDGNFTDSLGAPVRVSVTNAAAATPGTDRQTVGEIRQLAPESLRVLERAVAREDFELGAKQVAGIARALALGLDEDPAVAENTINLFVVPEDLGTPNQDKLDEVRAEFEAVDGITGTRGLEQDPPLPKVNSLRLNVYGPQYLLVNVATTVHLRKGATPAVVRAAIIANLTAFFALKTADGEANQLIDFGYYIQDEDGEPTDSLSWSDVFDVVRDTTGVLKIDDGSGGLQLNGFRLDVPIELTQFPKLGTVTITNAATGLPL